MNVNCQPLRSLQRRFEHALRQLVGFEQPRIAHVLLDLPQPFVIRRADAQLREHLVVQVLRGLRAEDRELRAAAGRRSLDRACGLSGWLRLGSGGVAAGMGVGCVGGCNDSVVYWQGGLVIAGAAGGGAGGDGSMAGAEDDGRAGRRERGQEAAVHCARQRDAIHPRD